MGRNRRDKSDRRKQKVEVEARNNKSAKSNQTTNQSTKNDQILSNIVCSIRKCLKAFFRSEL